MFHSVSIDTQSYVLRAEKREHLCLGGKRMTHLNRLLYAGLIFILLLGIAAVPEGTVRAAGGISLTAIGATYTQDFNTLASTGTTNNLDALNNGWYLSESGGGARDNEQYAAGNGSDNTGDTYSYGADGSTERALGSVRTGTLISMYGASFTNDTGSTITKLAIAYTGEEWRLGSAGRADQLTFEYSTSASSLTTGTWTGLSALNFTTPDQSTTGAKDGNAIGKRMDLSATISGLNIPNGSTFWVRWSDVDATSSDDGLAIDDFSLTPLQLSVIDVTSTSIDGTYGIGALIPIAIRFSSPVNVTGTPQLTLDTGAAGSFIDYTSGSGTDTLTFNYSVQAGEGSSDLDYVATTALSLNGGTIRDAATDTYDAILTLAAPGDSGSLGFNKAIVIDGLAPDTRIDSQPANPSRDTETFFTFDGTDNIGVTGFECQLDGSEFTACTASYTNLADGEHVFQVRAIDGIGNTDPTPASYTWVVDTIPPTVSLTSAATDPTNTSPIPVTIQFSETGTGFVADDITTSNGLVDDFTTVDVDTYTFNLIPSGQGVVTAEIAAGAVQDAAGNGNAAAASFRHTYDSVGPTVTLVRAATQPDPASVGPVHFTATFNETVTGFDNIDVDLGLSSAPGMLTTTVTGGPTIYDIEVNGITGGGNILASIPAGRAQDEAGNDNTASETAVITFTPLEITSSDHVTFATGNPGSFTVTTIGVSSPTLSATGTWPSGIGFTDNGDGTATLSGMPEPGSVGTYHIVFTAQLDGVAPNVTQNFTLTVEGPPGVHHINSLADTGDGQIIENEPISAALTQLLVTFNKDMEHIDLPGAEDVRTPLNYSLIRDGSTLIPIDSISYDPATFTATLSVNGGVALPDGEYTLSVSGTLEDSLGAPIGDDFIRHFIVDTTQSILQTPTDAEALLHRRPSFDWSDIPHAAKYKIQVSKYSTFKVLDINVIVTDSAYTPGTDLAANKKYFWRVKVQANGVWSPWSETWSFTTGKPSSIPVLVAPARGALVRDYTPVLDWKNSTTPAGRSFDYYRVQIASDPKFSAIILDEMTTPGTVKDSSFIPETELPANAPYYWRVRACNADLHYSSWSTVRSFRTALTPPVLISPAEEEVSVVRRPTLDWEDVTGATGYKLVVSRHADFSTPLLSVNITDSIYNASEWTFKLPANKVIYWRVKATGDNPSAWTGGRFITVR